MAKMKTVTAKLGRLEQLKELAKVLAANIDACENPSALAPLAKQYRETILEIEQIEGEKSDDDEIGEVLAQRQADGKSGTVRKNRAKG